jgi:hypothetical protein
MIRITPREGDNLIYVQPSFAVVDKAESSILVSRLRIQLARRGGEASPPPSFHWREVGEFYYTSDNPIPVYRLKGDAAPVVVSQSTPQSPLAVFESASWTLSAGQWDGTLVVMNQDGAALASLPFCVLITNEVATTLRQPEFQGKSLPFGSDPADVTRSAPGPCYT